MDLQKIKEKTIFSEYFELINAQGFYPRITLPTIFSEHHTTIIEKQFMQTDRMVTDFHCWHFN